MSVCSRVRSKTHTFVVNLINMQLYVKQNFVVNISHIFLHVNYLIGNQQSNRTHPTTKRPLFTVDTTL
jgi:hypothetical protein